MLLLKQDSYFTECLWSSQLLYNGFHNGPVMMAQFANPSEPQGPDPTAPLPIHLPGYGLGNQ